LVVLAAGGMPRAPIGAVLAAGVFAAAGGGLALATHWEADRAAAVLAVLVFIISTRMVRLVLRAARLRIPLLPRTAAELQEDIDPEPAAQVTQRTRLAVGYLDSLTAASAATFATAAILLVRSPQWATWLLAGLIGLAAALRARDTTGGWQRTALVLAGAAGTGFLLIAAVVHSRMPASAALLAAGLAAAGLLVVAAGRLPARRQAPIWGHLADRLEGLTSFALVPALLQVLHVYAYIRSLAG
ncbi:MAG TPA: type VII secretion integral membrane protein EccD, partial [Streptosporangiaceae bacterium]